MGKEERTKRGGRSELDRRDFLKAGALGLAAGAVTGCAQTDEAGAYRPPVPGQDTPDIGPDALANAAAVPSGLGAPPAQPFAAPPIEQVRIAYVGVGGMGTAHVRNLVRIDGCVITAVCDIREAHAERAADLIEEAGHPRPALYTNGETDYERLCAEEDLDLVYNATPWRWHVPICVAAMENGKHAATEVPAAYTLEGCWELVETAERTNRHCAMMENVNYGRAELLCLNLVRQGLLGEILHAECGYLHDLRGIKFADDGEGLWRRDHSWTRNGNLYPTHGLGPVANCMDINRGDRFASLVSMSSPSRGLQEYAIANYPEGHAKRSETFALGDVNGSLIQTAMGKTVYVAHDTNLPAPTTASTRSRGRAGSSRATRTGCTSRGGASRTAGMRRKATTRSSSIRCGGRCSEESIGAGHGGMDFMEDYRLIKCLREGLPLDMNVYDAAALSAVCELSEISVANGSAPVEFPDFTRGKWREWAPWPIVGA